MTAEHTEMITTFVALLAGRPEPERAGILAVLSLVYADAVRTSFPDISAGDLHRRTYGVAAQVARREQQVRAAGGTHSGTA